VSPRTILRALTPAGVGLAAVILIAILLIAGRGLGLHWDPFGLGARRLDRAERQAEAATAEAHARTLEVEGATAQARRLEQQHQQSVGLARVTAAAEAEARNAHDSDLPLAPDRAARLRDHDRELCRLAPVVCVAAPTGAAPDGADAVPAGPAAGRADPGRP
jgi:hypothetical protein